MGTMLAEFISHAQSLDESLPPAVATNLNITAEPHLTSSHVAPYTLVPLPNGKRMAVLALIDPTHLVSDHTKSAILPYEQALQRTLETLRRLPGGTPDVIVCMFSGVVVTEDTCQAADAPVAFLESGEQASKQTLVETIITRVI